MQKKKLMMLGGAAFLILLLVGGAVAWKMNLKKAQEAQNSNQPARKRKTQEVNIIPIAERPVVTLTSKDSHNVVLSVAQLKKPATGVEYELEYQAGSLLQAAFGELDLASLPVVKEILLGSCSAGGACTYHQDVKGGTLTLRFDGAEPYAVKSDWKYTERASDGLVSSRDSKFQLKADALKKASLLITYNSPGFPEGLTGTPVSEIYNISALGQLTGKGELTIRANEEGQLTIMGWDGSTWKSFPTTMDGKQATATVDLVSTYVAVKQ